MIHEIQKPLETADNDTDNDHQQGDLSTTCSTVWSFAQLNARFRTKFHAASKNREFSSGATASLSSLVFPNPRPTKIASRSKFASFGTRVYQNSRILILGQFLLDED